MLPCTSNYYLHLTVAHFSVIIVVILRMASSLQAVQPVGGSIWSGHLCGHHVCDSLVLRACHSCSRGHSVQAGGLPQAWYTHPTHTTRTPHAPHTLIHVTINNEYSSDRKDKSSEYTANLWYYLARVDVFPRKGAILSIVAFILSFSFPLFSLQISTGAPPRKPSSTAMP